MHDEWAGNAQYTGRIVGTELLVLGEDSDPPTLQKMAKSGLEQACGLRWQSEDPIFAGLLADPDFESIALAEIAKWLGELAVLIRELDELQHMGGHGWLLDGSNMELHLVNCNN